MGTYRKDRKLRADYSIGPSLNLPLAIHPGLQTVLEASAQRTRTSTIGFVGVRLLYTSGAMSVMSTFGRSIEDDRTDLSGARTQSTGGLTAQYSTQTPGGTLLTGEAGADRNINSSTVHAGGTIFSQLGNARLDLLHTVEGGRSTQYDLSFQSGLALSTHAARIGAQQTDQSALIIKVTGDSAAAFQVLVDESPGGKVRMGQPLSLFVPGYRRYRVRLVPIDAAQVDYDAGTRDVTLYPGNVQPLEWKAQSYFTLIAQAVKPGGKPIIDAIVRTKRAIAQTDSSGYFQLDLRRGDRIAIMNDGTAACQVQLPDLSVTGDYTSIGKVVCQ